MQASSGQEYLPGPKVVALRTPRGPELSSLTAVRREMSRVYRLVRAGKIRTEDGSRIAFMLTSLAKMVEAADIEPRLRALEERLL